MNTTQLECFLAVAENLNFARAAEALHITQPAVTHQIAALEAELDAKLFIRTTRSVQLTPEGWSFQTDAKNILGITYGAKAKLAHQSRQEIRYFGIGCHSALELSLLPPILKRMHEKYPLLHPDLKMIPFRSLQNLLDEESIAVMMSFHSADRRKEPGTFMELCRVPVSCVLSPSHPFAGRASLSLKELRQGGMVLCEPGKNPAAIARVQGQLIGFHPPEELYFTENPACALAIVRAGLGFTLLPDMIPMRLPDLVYVPVADAGTLSYGLYYKTLKDQPLLKEFIGWMQEEFCADSGALVTASSPRLPG